MRSCPQCGNDCNDEHKFCPSCGFPIGKVAVDSDDPLIGRTLPGGYVILELVGIGGMGRVYRAEQTNLGRTVAVKIIHPHLVGEENAAARFITEARAASRLNHPNSVAVIDFGKTQDGQLYLVMEFLRGRDLARVAYEEGPLSFRRIVNVLRQTLAALSEAHHLGIIHRDLKPENIILEPMRTGGDFVKVVDFGLAKVREAEEKPSITSPGIVCGTPEYMSPEQGRGDTIDARSDLYAVGVIFFQMLTGRLPFEADSPTQVVLMHISTPPPDPRKIAPDRQIPEPLVNVLLMAMAKEPEHRFSDADEFGAALADAMQQVEGSATMKAAQAAQIKCPACGAMNPTTQKFCGECGAAMGAGVPSTAIPGSRRAGASIPPPSVAPLAIEPATGARGVALKEDKVRFPLPLVGREEDLAWLEERRDDAERSLGGARLVGEAGVGKSRLLKEFLLLCAAAGDSVVVVGPDPAWAEVGYYALRKAIAGLAALGPDGGTVREWTGAGAEARRGLMDVFGKEDSTSNEALTPEDRRYAAAEAFRWSLIRASERAHGQRVIVAIDDLHSVDGASRNAFADAIGEPPLIPALLVAAYTPGFDPNWTASSAVARVLTGLQPPVVAKLLAATGAASVPSFAGSQRGIAPLQLEQLLRFTRELGSGAPTRLADLISLRVERLSADARRVLQAIAVYGDDAGDDAITRLVPEDTNLSSALSVLLRAGMIEDAPDGLRTSHPLLREIVLATIPAAVRKDLHHQAAGVCESHHAPMEVLAMHEYFAQNTFQALILLERVASRAAARGDLHGSVNALRRGLELARRELFRGEIDDPMRAVLIFSRKLGEALAEVGDYLDAEGVLREALDMTGPSGQDRARVLGTLAHVAHGRDRVQEALLYLVEAIELAHQSGSRDLVSSLEDMRKRMAG
ncbi:MAG TPA: protein kinase [Polyangiaceae bacterium]|jgi:serine/threonine-protein kinase